MRVIGYVRRSPMKPAQAGFSSQAEEGPFGPLKSVRVSGDYLMAPNRACAIRAERCEAELPTPS